MALTLQLSTQGLCCAIMALYGQALVHFPHSIHFSLSITAFLLMIVIAPRGHTSLHLCNIQPRQAGVTYIPAVGHSSQAISITSTTFGLFLSPPIAILILS